MAAPPKKTGLSLYASLLGEPNQQPGATISSAPVRYDNAKKEGAADEQKRKDAALQFQPVRRPQGNNIKRPAVKKAGAGPGHAFSSSTSTSTVLPSVGTAAATSSPDKQPPPTSTPSLPRTSNFEDWVGDEDDDAFYAEQQSNKTKHERGGKKKRNKKAKSGQLGGEERRTWSWDDIYDPSLPNTFAEYRGSEEQVGEIRDWKARLYHHRMKRARKSVTPVTGEKRAVGNNMFAPPASLSFAPPSFDDVPSKAPPMDDDDDDAYFPPEPPSVPSRHPDTSDSYEPPVSFSQPPFSMVNGPTDEDPYLRRTRLSGASPSTAMPPPPMPMPMDPRLQQQQAAPPPPPPAAPPVLDAKAAAEIEVKRAEAAAKIAAFKAKVEAAKLAKTAAAAAAAAAASPAPAPVLSVSEAGVSEIYSPPPPPLPAAPEVKEPTPEPEAGATISRAPVRYQFPAAPSITSGEDSTVPEQESAEESRSNRPGQKGFAERLLKKYGWEKGAGLGAKGNEGITTAIVAKAEKRKKLADAQGGGWKTPGNMGKLVGGKRRKVGGDSDTVAGDGAEEEPFGPLSSVIKLSNMLTGLDVDEEIQEKDLYGEIGREFEGEYGKVERVFIWRAGTSDGEAKEGQDEVFVKFVSPLSALRAVGACEGMEFAGNLVRVRFWPEERFGEGVYG